jgi:hypothetical protein
MMATSTATVDRRDAMSWLREPFLEAARSPLGGAPPGLVELAVVSALSAALAAAVFGPHVLNGGWAMDDWALVAGLEAANRAGGLHGAFDAAMDIVYRPGYGVTLH